MASWKEKQRQNYLNGVARRPHSHSRTLCSSSDGADPSHSADGNPSICPQCYILSWYITLMSLSRWNILELSWRNIRDQTLTQRKEIQTLDITKQSDWLRSNVFDSQCHTHTLAVTTSHTPAHTLSHTQVTTSVAWIVSRQPLEYPMTD